MDFNANGLRGDFSLSVSPSKRATHFPNTFHERIDDPFQGEGTVEGMAPALSDYNPRLAAVERMTSQAKPISPFLAWAQVLERTGDDLPVLLGVGPATAKRLVENPTFSPPVENVMKFCLTLGVHPAYLRPSADDSRTTYPAAVMDALIAVAQDDGFSERDRAQSVRAMERERARFERLASEKPDVAGYLMATSYPLLTGMTATQASLIDDFRLAVDDAAGDVDLALDFRKESLKQDLARIEAKLVPYQMRSEATGTRIGDVARALWGNDRADDVLNKLFKDLGRCNPEFDCEINAGTKAYATLTLSTSRWEIDLPHFDWNFKDNCERDLDMSAQEAIAELVDLAPAHLDRLADYNRRMNQIQPELSAAGWKLKNFSDWRKSDASREHHIPLYENFRRVESVLGRKDAPEYKINLPAVINPEIDRIFPHMSK